MRGFSVSVHFGQYILPQDNLQSRLQRTAYPTSSGINWGVKQHFFRQTNDFKFWNSFLVNIIFSLGGYTSWTYSSVQLLKEHSCESLKRRSKCAWVLSAVAVRPFLKTQRLLIGTMWYLRASDISGDFKLSPENMSSSRLATPGCPGGCCSPDFPQ